jgi:hypothetical protein
MEDATLSELFSNAAFPEGSIFMYGTASFLATAGTGMYASDWLSVVSHTEGTWPL